MFLFECALRSDLKMILTNFFIASALSMSNLTLFVDQLITDGKYKTVLLIHDRTSVRDSNFIPQLTELGFGKYATVIVNMRHLNGLDLGPYRVQSGILQIVMIKYGAPGESRVKQLIDASSLRQSRQNMVMLIPMQSDNEKKEFWLQLKGSNIFTGYGWINTTVIFYQTEQSMANTTRKPFEVFVINYKADQTVDALEIEKWDHKNQATESNLHEQIFGSIMKKPNLILSTTAAVNRSITKATLRRGNETLINLGSAANYLSNFIARNLRFKDVMFQQVLKYFPLGVNIRASEILDMKFFYNCYASNENTYGELYNKIPEKRPFTERFVDTFLRIHLKSKIR